MASACANAHHGGAAAKQKVANPADAAIPALVTDAALSADASLGLLSPCAPGDTRQVASACQDGRTCLAVCIAGTFRTWCSSCDQPAPNCPSDPPAQDSPCEQSQATCTYAHCDREGVVEANCSAGRWALTATVCGATECVFTEDDGARCTIDQACALGDPFAGSCPSRGQCQPSPCLGQPFSCACAAALCGPYELCSDAAAGKVSCVPNRALTNLPEDVAGPAESSFVIVNGALCGVNDCVDPASGSVRMLPNGLGPSVRTFYQGYLYGVDSVSLTRLALDGSSVEKVLDAAPAGFDFASDTLYFVRRDSSGNGADDIVAAALDGSHPHTVFANQTDTIGLHVYAGALYWQTGSTLVQQVLPTGEQRRVELAVYALALGVFVGGALYWFDDAGRALHQLDLASFAVTNFSDIPGRALATDGQALYFATPASSSGQRLVRVQLDNGVPAVPSELARIDGINDPVQFDGTFVYWRGCTGVVRVPK